MSLPPLPPAYQVCVTSAAATYLIPQADLVAAIDSPHAADQIGPAGVPTESFARLQTAGFNPFHVVARPCTNIRAAAWLISKDGLPPEQQAVARLVMASAALKAGLGPNQPPQDPLPSSETACIPAAARRYHVSPGLIETVLRAAEKEKKAGGDGVTRSGPMGIPAQGLWLVAHNGFDPYQVQVDVCANIDAGAFLLALEGLGAGPVSTGGTSATPEGAGPGPAQASRTPPGWVITLAEHVAAQENLPVALLLAVGAQESGFRAGVTSSAGAQGLMQLMPATARRFGVADSFDPAANMRGAGAYLAHLEVEFHGNLPLVLAGYNAGGGAVHSYGGIPPFAETIAYVRTVLSRFRYYQTRYK